MRERETSVSVDILSGGELRQSERRPGGATVFGGCVTYDGERAERGRMYGRVHRTRYISRIHLSHTGV